MTEASTTALPATGGISARTVARRSRSGARAQIRGVGAETLVCAALEARGWQILMRRVRTGCGELDIVAERDAENLIAFIEVKGRPSLAQAAWALSTRQQLRLQQAAQALIALHPEWSHRAFRFDLVLVDQTGRMRRIIDAVRTGD